MKFYNVLCHYICIYSTGFNVEDNHIHLMLLKKKKKKANWAGVTIIPVTLPRQSEKGFPYRVKKCPYIDRKGKGGGVDKYT